MASIPVSFDYFKKYTNNHEECIDNIFKSTPHKYKELYKINKSSSNCREKALRQYYEAFYLNPQIRKNYHIQLKPVPKYIKDKILQIPPVIVTISDDEEPINEESQNKSHGLNKSKKDDIPQNDHSPVIDVIEMINNSEQHQINISNNMLPVLYDEFKKYTYYEEVVDKMFKIKCNGNENKYQQFMDSEAHKENALRKYYEAYYLKPEIREKMPIRFKPAPRKIKEKLLQIPVHSDFVHYPSEKDANNNAGNYQESNVENMDDVTVIKDASDKPINEGHVVTKGVTIVETQNYSKSQKEQDQQLAATSKNVNISQLSCKDLLAYEHCCPIQYQDFEKYTNVIQLFSEIYQKKFGNDKSKLLELSYGFYLKFYLQAEVMRPKPFCNKLIVNDNCPSDIKVKLFEIPENIYLRDDITTQNHNSAVEEPVCVEQPNVIEIKNNPEQHQINKISNNMLPVLYDEFKKFTYYEEVVDKIFKIKCKGNENKYQQFTNSEADKEIALRKYYEAYYLNPEIREKMPIRFKPAPRKIKEKLLQIPVQADFVNYPSEKDTNNNARNYQENDDENMDDANVNKDAIDKPINEGHEVTKGGNIVETQNESKAQKEQDQHLAAISKNVNISQLSCKDLLAYEHCCPIQYQDFEKYTNVIQLFSEIYQKKFGNDKSKLLELSYGFYLKFYLQAEVMRPKPFCNKLIVNDNCPSDIKVKLFEISENIYLRDDITTQNHNSAVEEPFCCAEQQNVIEIKNNPELHQINKISNNMLPMSYEAPGIKRGLKTYNQLPCKKRLKLANQEIDKDDNLVNHVKTGEQEEQNINPGIIQISTKNSVIILENLLIQSTKDNPLSCSTHSNTTTNKRTLDSMATTNIIENNAEHRILAPAIDTSNKLGHTTEPRNPEDDIIQLLDKSTFNKCRAKMIKKFANPFNCTSFPVTFDDFKESNLIPLEKIVNDFTQQNEIITNMFLMDKELCDALLYNYYIKYHTTSTFRKKYPSEKICKVPGNNQQQQNITSNSTLPIDSQCLEKTKRIFFHTADKCHSLSYLIRTTFGLKQNIIRTLFSMTFEEFRSSTCVYEGSLLYNSSDDLKNMYQYVFRSCQIWPTNLFIKISDLCKLLQTKNIIFSNYSTMLQHISPKFLHWQDLCVCTNFEDCLSIDYQRRTGSSLNTSDDVLLLKEYNDYYKRCWKYEKWITATPLVKEQLVETLKKDICNIVDVTMLNVSDLQEVCEQPLEPVTNISTVGLSDVTVLKVSDSQEVCVQPLNNISTVELSDVTMLKVSDSQEVCLQPLEPPTYISTVELCSSDDETDIYVETPEVACTITVIEEKPLENTVLAAANVTGEYVLIPNTQHQIDMLPDEVVVDPLDQFGCKPTLNDSDDDNARILDDSVEVISVGELQIKMEPTKKPLKNLFFYEDADNNIQCTPCEEDIISLDDSIMDERLLSFEVCNSPSPTQLFSEDTDADAVINLGQRLPSSTDTSQSTQLSQNFMLDNSDGRRTTSTQRIQLQDVNLASSGSTNGILDDDHNMSDVIGLQNYPNSLEYQLKQLPSTLDFNDMSNEPMDQSPLQLSGLISSTPPNVDTFPEAQRLCSTFEHSQPTTTGSNNNTPSAQPATLLESQYFHSSFEDSQTPTNVQQNNVASGVTNVIKKTIAGKCVLQVAKVKPLKNYIFVEQRLHPIRPLPQNSAQTTNVQKESSTNAARKVPQTISITSAATQIHISQELSKNCTLFNNSSLLNIIDQNYQLSQPASSALPARKLPEDDTSEVSNTMLKAPVSQMPTSSSSVPATRRNSTHKVVDGNKVNTLSKSIQTGRISPIIQLRYQPNQIIRKICFYRDLIQFHFFKELSPQHIAQYLLPSADISKCYVEATIVCENFKTRLCNNSISALFPYWSKSLQHDFLLILNDLKEFHYTPFEVRSIQKQEDLRHRILFWFIYSNPKFSHWHLIYESNNTEFARLETVSNYSNPSYKRAPFACLTNSLDSTLLVKLKEMKRNLKSSKFSVENC